MKITPYAEGMQIDAGMIISGMPNAVYHGLTSWLSNSALQLFMRSPAHLYCSKPRTSTRFMEIGTAIHAAILEPELFASEYMLLPDVTDRRASAYKDAVKHYGSERVLVSSEINSVIGMQQAASLNADWQAVRSQPGYTELSFFGMHRPTSTPVKCRFDFLTESGHAVDLKKTQDVRVDALQRSVLNYNYHHQQAFYSMVFESVTGQPLQSFRFLFVEQDSPHSNVMVSLCEETMGLAYTDLGAAMEAFEACDNHAEGIYQPSTIIGLPEWYLNREIIGEIE